MKKFFALFTALVLASSLFFVSCVVEEEQCEKDNIGTVKIFNESGESWMFDVTYSKDADGDWVTNEELSIDNNGSYTYDNVGAGEVAIWAKRLDGGWEISDIISLGACQDYVYTFKGECTINDVGYVTVTNNSGEWWYFDVTSEKDENGDWQTVDEVRISNGESYTWEVSNPDEIAIWTSDNTIPWEISQLTNLEICEEYIFNATARCQLFNYTNVKVLNSTGDNLWVDVYSAGGWIEERLVEPNATATYSRVEAGEIQFASRYDGQTEWTYSDGWTAVECEDFEFTWNAGKKASLPTGTKENVERAPKAIKIGSKVDYSDAPAK
jgi:hypothetical protein